MIIYIYHNTHFKVHNVTWRLRANWTKGFNFINLFHVLKYNKKITRFIKRIKHICNTKGFIKTTKVLISSHFWTKICYHLGLAFKWTSFQRKHKHSFDSRQFRVNFFRATGMFPSPKQHFGTLNVKGWNKFSKFQGGQMELTQFFCLSRQSEGGIRSRAV